MAKSHLASKWRYESNGIDTMEIFLWAQKHTKASVSSRTKTLDSGCQAWYLSHCTRAFPSPLPPNHPLLCNSGVLSFTIYSVQYWQSTSNVSCSRQICTISFNPPSNSLRKKKYYYLFLHLFFLNSDEAQKSNLAKDTQLPGTEVKIQTWVGYHKNMSI